jgi:DNA-dependent protein kinase catalytic subunit
MDMGVSDAGELFPRLLELIDEYPETSDYFKTCSSQLSAIWLLLPWLPQIVAVLDKPIASSVNPLVTAIAKTYPKALYYPMAISREHYKFENTKAGRRQAQQVQVVWSYLSSPLMNDFITELRRLTNPEHIVKDFIDYAMVKLLLALMTNACFQTLNALSYRVCWRIQVGNPKGLFRHSMS